MIALTQVLSNLPFFAIYVLAAVLALARWDRHPTTSVLVLTAAVISVLARVAAFALPTVLARSGSDSGTTITLLFGITSMVSNIGLGCLVAAAFVERSTRSGPPPQFR